MRVLFERTMVTIVESFSDLLPGSNSAKNWRTEGGIRDDLPHRDGSNERLKLRTVLGSLSGQTPSVCRSSKRAVWRGLGGGSRTRARRGKGIVVEEGIIINSGGNKYKGGGIRGERGWGGGKGAVRGKKSLASCVDAVKRVGRRLQSEGGGERNCKDTGTVELTS